MTSIFYINVAIFFAACIMLLIVLLPILVPMIITDYVRSRKTE